MRSRSVRALIAKEWRELLSSRAWWVMLVAIGPLVGVTFISAVRTYAELSGLNGTAAGVGEAFSPLIGIWAPTFSAAEIAAVFLLPFVSIRLVAGDQQSGAAKIELQSPLPASMRIATKAAVLMVAWLIASTPTLIAILLWRAYGGAIHPPELATALLGHMLNAGLTIGFASAMAVITEHPSTAAIATLGATIGSWIVDFMASLHGGAWARVARFMPAAMVAEFQHGLIRLPVVLTAVAIITSALAIAAIWMRLGVAIRRRAFETAAVLGATAVAIAAAAGTHASWDTSEQRINSFSRADEAALSTITERLDIEMHLAPEDPRRVDLERAVIAKLDRTLQALSVRYVSTTSAGLFEQTRDDYGEVWYALGGRRALNRSTNVESVLDTVYELAGISQPPARAAPDVYRGHPLASPPRGANVVFYAGWPAFVLVLLRVSRWRFG